MLLKLVILWHAKQEQCLHTQVEGVQGFTLFCHQLIPTAWNVCEANSMQQTKRVQQSQHQCTGSDYCLHRFLSMTQLCRL